MANLFDKETIFNKLKDEAEKKGFNVNPDRENMSNGCATITELLEIIAIVLNDLFIKDDSMSAELTATDIKLNAGGDLKGVARKEDEITIDVTTDSKFMSFIEALYTVLDATVVEPGNSSPSALQLALKLALKPFKPTKIKGKVTTASDKVKTT